MSPALFLFLMAAVGFVAYTLAIPAYSSTGSALGQQDFGEDAASIHHSFADSEPAFNIDGTPMLGAFDMNGNPYGVTQSHNDFIDYSGTDHATFEDDPFEHCVNIDGTPMCGDIDIHGDPCGVTDWHTDTWDCGTSSSSMFD